GGQGDGARDLSNTFNPAGTVRMGAVYDGNSRVAARIDANGQRTSFAYDAVDRLVAVTYADGTMETRAYDKDGDLVLKVDPNQSRCEMRYDALGRRVETTITRGPGVGGSTHQTFAYDGLSRVVRAADDNGD